MPNEKKPAVAVLYLRDFEGVLLPGLKREIERRRTAKVPVPTFTSLALDVLLERIHAWDDPRRGKGS